MPVGLEARCWRALEEVVEVSERIRRSALAHTNNQNLSVSDGLRRQLETIRISADAILGAFTTASLTNETLDGRVVNWLFGGELPLCLDKLKEMDKLLKHIGPVRPVPVLARPLRPTEDRLTAVMGFFDKHRSLFYFLLTCDVWNRENPLQLPRQLEFISIEEGTQHNYQKTQTRSTTPTEYDTGSEYCTASEYDDGENGSLTSGDKSLTTKDKKNFLHTYQRLDEVLRWLAPLNCTEKHNRTLRLRQEGTCKWFPNTDVYKSWRVGGNQFLWLHGKAGCGKSVLVASTIEHLRNTLEDEEVVVFFYCDFRNGRSTSPAEVMRSVLSQLFCHLRDHGVDPGDLLNKILEQKSKGALSLNDLDVLCDLVSRVADCFSRYEPIIVIDALDECADIEPLLRALVTLNRGDVRLLVTSRPDQIITDHFSGLQSLSLENVAKELAGDIALHVRFEVDSHNWLRFADTEMKEEIYTKLNEKVDGRFRWAQCQLNTLKRCATRPELREALDNLPNELETTYERILEAIDERKMEGMLARRTLVWLAVAFEPLRLAQIVNWFSVDARQQRVYREIQSLGAALLHALSSLVSYDEKTDVLALSHFSVKEYIVSHIALPMYHITSCEAHAEVVQMCMCYISAFLKQVPTRCNAMPLETFPMLSYILSSGFNHLTHVNPRSSLVLEGLRSLGSDVRNHPSHWERLCELREEVLGCPYPPWPSSRHDFVPYILIAYSSPGLLESFLSSGFLPKPRIGTNPFVYAADLRKTKHAMVLLTSGVDVNLRGLVVDGSHYTFPLDASIDLGDDTVVNELLQRGCVVSPELLASAICMPWCSTRVLVRLMQTNEFVEWAHKIGDDKLYHGVFNSARPNAGDSRKTDEDHVSMARILRQVGLNLSADSQFGAELIERAVHAAHTSMLEFLLPQDQPPPPRFLLAAATGDTSETVFVVRFLLRKGADVHAVSDGRRDTALHLAVMCPWEPRRLELAELLIKAGCNPTTRNSDGQTVLDIAFVLGYTSVVELLLLYDVSLPSDVLPSALQKRATPQMVDFLIQKGADLHSSTPDGDTALHLAITKYPESECLDLFKKLVEAGCDPTTHNSKGKTAFEVAFWRGHVAVVEQLLSYNTPFPPDILLVALKSCATLQLVESLIRKGADIHSTTPDGDTVLHLALTEYTESTCLDLFKKFIEAGCNLITSDSQHKTVLDVAVERGYSSVVELLLLYGIPFPSDVLPTALQKCAPLQMIDSFLRKGANIHPTTPDGDTLLHLAITGYTESTCLDLLKKLIEAGCDPTIPGSKGKTIFEVAFWRRYIAVVELLLARNVPFPPDILPIALQNHSAPQIVEYLIRNGADVHSTTSRGDTVVHLAINKYAPSTCLSLVKDFIEVGCDPSTRNSRGQTAYEIAILRGYTSVVEFLWSRKVPFPPDILPAVLQKRPAPHIVEYLIRNGADVHSTTSGGDTVLHLTVKEYAESTCLSLVKSFIEAGCSPTTRDSIGQTVLETAMVHGYTSVVELLISHVVPFPSAVPPSVLQKHVPPRMPVKSYSI